MKHIKLCVFVCLVALLVSSCASAEFLFSDDRFVGDFSTDNLNRIIDEYELYDGWYWTTAPYILQTFHGQEDAPGWTDTAVNKMNRKYFTQGLYGCRWMANKVFAETPGIGGYGECFGFAQFIGYLLSGETNPHHHWDAYYDFESSGGLRVGDILRIDIEVSGKPYRHSAIVYSVSDDEILFLQVSGSLYNRISVGDGFRDGYHNAPRTPEDLSRLVNIKICRSPLNQNPAEK